MKFSRVLNPYYKANTIILSTNKTIEIDVILDDPFVDEIIESPFNWYSNYINKFTEQGLTLSN